LPIRWVVHHAATIAVTGHVDGHIVLASGSSVELDVSCLGAEQASSAIAKSRHASSDRNL